MVATIFSMCLASMSSYTELENCTRAGVETSGGEWHCTASPDGTSKVCTDEVWQFERLYREALFSAAKKAAK